MKWEPVENAEKMLEDGDVVLCWIIVLDNYKNEDYDTFDMCEYSYAHNSFFPYSSFRFYRITHFMIIEEPHTQKNNAP